MKRLVELHSVLDRFLIAFVYHPDGTHITIEFGHAPIDIVTDRFLLSNEDARFGLNIQKLTY